MSMELKQKTRRKNMPIFKRNYHIKVHPYGINNLHFNYSIIIQFGYDEILRWSDDDVDDDDDHVVDAKEEIFVLAEGRRHISSDGNISLRVYYFV